MSILPTRRMRIFVLVACLRADGAAAASETLYRTDPDHTSLSFEVDHLGDQSVRRGEFACSIGRIPMDTAASSNVVEPSKCMPNRQHARKVCGADARGQFGRDRFGIAAGEDHGFAARAQLRLQVEAVADDDTLP